MAGFVTSVQNVPQSENQTFQPFVPMTAIFSGEQTDFGCYESLRQLSLNFVLLGHRKSLISRQWGVRPPWFSLCRTLWTTALQPGEILPPPFSLSLSLSLSPVSYTHLDVYKRQVMSTLQIRAVCRKLFDSVWTCGCYRLPQKIPLLKKRCR